MKIVWPWVTSTKAFFSGASHHNATALKLYVKYLNFKFTILLPETSLQIFVQSTRVGVSWQEPPAYHNWKRLNLKNSSTFEVSGWRWKPLQIHGFSAKKGSVGTRKKKGGNANIFSIFTNDEVLRKRPSFMRRLELHIENLSKKTHLRVRLLWKGYGNAFPHPKKMWTPFPPHYIPANTPRWHHNAQLMVTTLTFMRMSCKIQQAWF